jgi:transcriptional regulator with XRE-family HTH domain
MDYRKPRNIGRRSIMIMINPVPMRDAESKAALQRAGQLIRDARKRAGLSQVDLGARLGVTQSVVSDWERGELESWRDYLDGLARALGVSTGYFAAPTTRGRGTVLSDDIEVVGEVQGGAFRVAVEYAPEDRYALPAIAAPGYERVARHYLKVVGDSVNQVFPDGSYICVVSAADTDVRSGDMVVVYNQQAGLTEATVKEVRLEADGRIALWPRSTHADFQTPIYLSEDNGDSPEIAYVVIGSYRPVERPPAPLQFPRGRR